MFIISIIILIIAAVCFCFRNSGTDDGSYPFRIAWKITASLWLLATFIACVSIVPSGSVGVVSIFGRIQPASLTEGLNITPPWVSVEVFSIRRISVHPTTADQPVMEVIASDNVPISVDGEMPYSINPTYASELRRWLGSEQEIQQKLVLPSARSALKDSAFGITGMDLCTTKRAEFEKGVTEHFAKNLGRQLEKLPAFKDLSQEEREGVIQVFPVQLGSVLPPDKVKNAIAEKAAAQQDLERQAILAKIAEEEAKRRGNEGDGIAQFIAKLPPNMEHGEAIGLLGALASLENAKALHKAVESEKAGTFNFVVGSSGGVAIPTASTTK